MMKRTNDFVVVENRFVRRRRDEGGCYDAKTPEPPRPHMKKSKKREKRNNSSKTESRLMIARKGREGKKKDRKK